MKFPDFKKLWKYFNLYRIVSDIIKNPEKLKQKKALRKLALALFAILATVGFIEPELLEKIKDFALLLIEQLGV